MSCVPFHPMILFILAIAFTITTSAFCSMCEGLVLSSTTSTIEKLKNNNKRQGLILESFKRNIEETTSAILTLNTLANTLGAMVVGGLSTQIFGTDSLWVFSLVMTLTMLIFAEVLPKNLAILYQVQVLKYLVYPLYWLCYIMQPLSILFKATIRFFAEKKTVLNEADEEILLLAEKSAKEGKLSNREKNMIANALSLDTVIVNDIMTPRNVVVSFDVHHTIEDILKQHPAIPFSRVPVYDKELDNVVGLVRRRDIFKAKANQQKGILIKNLKQNVLFIPTNVTVADALSQFLKHHEQFAVVVDEFGAVAGVLALEDIIEQILGQEIFEKDDVAVDMRAFARSRLKNP